MCLINNSSCTTLTLTDLKLTVLPPFAPSLLHNHSDEHIIIVPTQSYTNPRLFYELDNSDDFIHVFWCDGPVEGKFKCGASFLFLTQIPPRKFVGLFSVRSGTHTRALYLSTPNTPRAPLASFRHTHTLKYFLLKSHLKINQSVSLSVSLSSCLSALPVSLWCIATVPDGRFLSLPFPRWFSGLND